MRRSAFDNYKHRFVLRITRVAAFSPYLSGTSPWNVPATLSQNETFDSATFPRATAHDVHSAASSGNRTTAEETDA